MWQLETLKLKQSGLVYHVTGSLTLVQQQAHLNAVPTSGVHRCISLRWTIMLFYLALCGFLQYILMLPTHIQKIFKSAKSIENFSV